MTWCLTSLATARFTITPPARGWLGGEVRIEEDAAPWDDARWFALRVPPPPRVLLVRGDGARADLVALAFGVAAEGGSVSVNEIAGAALDGADLDRYDAVVLVGADPTASTGRLEAFVAAGGGVLAFPGAEPETLNSLLSTVGGGQISGTLGASDGDRLGTSTEVDLDHPLFAGVFDSARPTPEAIDIRRIARYRPGGGDESTLIGTRPGSPLLQEIRHGAGSVLLVGVAADLGWSDLPQRGLFVPLLFRSAGYLAAGSSVDDSGDRDGSGQVRVTGVDASAPLRLVGPDGATVTPSQRTVPGAVLLDVADVASRAGLYRVVQGERTLRVIAVNEDARQVRPRGARSRRGGTSARSHHRTADHPGR